MHLVNKIGLSVAISLILVALPGGIRPLHAEATGDVTGAPEVNPPSMIDQKLEAETDKLRAEAESLRALRPFSREATAWLAAAGTIAGGALGAFITYVINRMGQQRLRQERELTREKHNLELFQRLGNDNLAAASVLLDRLKRLQRLERRNKRPQWLQWRNKADDLEVAEMPLIKKVLISSLKRAHTRTAYTGKEPTGGENVIDIPGEANTPQEEPTLRKFIADELADTLSARFSAKAERPAKAGVSPLGEGPEFQECDLRDIYWANVDARGLDFYRSDLSRASLRGAALQRATFYECVMIEAVLQEADLTQANLMGAQLTRANLHGATLKNASLQGADLTDADLNNVDLRGTIYNTKTLQDRFQPTRWPAGFDPSVAGAMEMNEVYRPGKC